MKPQRPNQNDNHWWKLALRREVGEYTFEVGDYVTVAGGCGIARIYSFMPGLMVALLRPTDWPQSVYDRKRPSDFTFAKLDELRPTQTVELSDPDRDGRSRSTTTTD